MPTYVYGCSNNHETEVQQRITDPALTKCPHPDCEAKATRLISAPGFILKGGGWFADGYSSAPSGKSRGAKKDRS